MRETTRSLVLTYSNSNVLDGSTFTEEGENALFTGTEPEISNKDSGGFLS